MQEKEKKKFKYRKIQKNNLNIIYRECQKKVNQKLFN